MHTRRVLFILKERNGYYGGVAGPNIQSSGLYNSAKFVSDMLNSLGVESRLVEVIDNNDIDREVTKYKPTDVIIEALWVVPEKFAVLQKLHPRVRWNVRIHSELPFLAQEGIAMDWILKYIKIENVWVSFNSADMFDAVKKLVSRGYSKKVVYLPNYFLVEEKLREEKVEGTLIEHFDVGCFGAIRQMKNQLLQAVAAIEFADRHGKNLRFHISNSIHGGEHGYGILKNIRALFANTSYELIEHDWQSHEEFTRVVEQMDLGLQVSFNESFNLISADFVNARIPIVTSPAIWWTSEWIQANPTSVEDVIRKMGRAIGVERKLVLWKNLKGLRSFANATRRIWMTYLSA